MQILFDALTDRARISREDIALERPERTVSYGQLEREYRRLSSELSLAGVGPGNVVLSLARERLDAVIAVLAILHRGAVYACLDPVADAARTREIARTSGARHALVSGERIGTFFDRTGWHEARTRAGDEHFVFEHVRVRIPCLAFGRHAGFLSALPDPRGALRLVVRDAATLEARVVRELAHDASDASIRWLQWAPPQSDAFLCDVFGTLGSGGVLVFPEESCDRSDPWQLDASIRCSRAQMLRLGASDFRHWCEQLVDEAPPIDLRQVRVPRSGVRPSDVSRFTRRFKGAVTLLDSERRRDWARSTNRSAPLSRDSFALRRERAHTG